MALSSNKRTYHKRALPSPPAIAFSSCEGREIFAEALQLGTMIGFFKLIEQFTTQEEPQYCGLAALSMTLNALGIDPRRTWKGSWRWFSETMLDCCVSMDDVKRDGITLKQAACLARCNGADVSLYRSGTFDADSFRQALREVCTREGHHMVVSYSRKTFLQSGDGHFSPIGGYHPHRDLVLILDVARFKYSPHWVRLEDMLQAMAMLDPATGRPRGFLILGNRHPRESALFALAPHVPTRHPAANHPTIPTTTSSSLESGDLVTTTTRVEAPATPVLGSPFTQAGSLPRFSAATSIDTGYCVGGGGGGGGVEGTAEQSAGVVVVVAAVAAGAPPSVAPDSVPELVESADLAAVAVPALPSEGSAVPDEVEGEAAAGAVPSGDRGVVVGGRGSPAWVAAHRFIRQEAPELVGRLLAGDWSEGGRGQRGAGTGGGGKEGEEANHEEGEEDEEGKQEQDGVEAGGGRKGRMVGATEGRGVIPTLESLVGALVAAAPLESVCALLARRPTLGSVGETHSGPCCACPGGAVAAGVLPAPCNSAVGGGGNARVVPLTEAAVAAVTAGHVAAAAASGDPKSTAWYIPAAAPATEPTADYVAAAADDATGAKAMYDNRNNSADAVQDPAGEYVGGRAGSSASSVLSSSDADSLLESAGPSSGDSSYGSSSGAGSCCHGEPLEHHCVPPQVQTLVADELRFTNMFKLVQYCLRRGAGCPHVQPPDLSAFMQGVPAKPTTGSTSTTTSNNNNTSSNTIISTTTPTATTHNTTASNTVINVAAEALMVADPFAALPTLTPCASRTAAAATATTAAAAAVAPAAVPTTLMSSSSQLSAPPSPPSAAAATPCDCGDLGLPELAAEKLTTLLLLLPPPPTTATTAATASVNVRRCSRPRCRRCQRRAAAAGDWAAVLELLRAEWERLLRLAPLGLFASAPVLREELSYIGMQLSHVDN